MYGRQYRLLVFSLLVVILALGFGCTQPENVVTPFSSTRISLEANLVPTLPTGYVYELWVVDTANSYISLGKYYWDNESSRYFDIDSNEIDPTWTAEIDVLNEKYQYFAVSVESVPDLNPTTPEAVMLRTEIADPQDNAMWMSFPADFSLGVVGFCLETPTDKDSHSKDACGVWFALYTYDSINITDTIGVSLAFSSQQPRDLYIDTLYWECALGGWDGLNCTSWVDVTTEVLLDPNYEYDTLVVDTINLDDIAATLDTIGIACKTTLIDSNFIYDTLNIDTFIHISMDYDFIAMPVNVTAEMIDTFFVDTCTGETTFIEIEPFTDYVHSLIYTRIPHAYLLDQFIANYEEMPDLSGTDWHYKGWVLSPYLDSLSVCPDLGKMTKPAWSVPPSAAIFAETFPGADDWKVISTGSFKNFEQTDLENPYSMNLRVPGFPGEDFISNLPCGADSFYFAPDTLAFTGAANTRIGDIYITLEPDNFNQNTNFPFFLFATQSTIPSYNDVSDITANRDQSFLMQLLGGEVVGNPFGFPRIRVQIVRE